MKPIRTDVDWLVTYEFNSVCKNIFHCQILSKCFGEQLEKMIQTLQLIKLKHLRPPGL